MRIISGNYKGRAITPNKSFNARPTTDFAKESLFNILNNNFDYKTLDVLDLFTGTGSISYEFASRGANFVTCVDISYKNIEFIRKTAEDLQLNIKPVKANVFGFLNYCKKTFNIIFADPPYELNKIDTLPNLILEKKLLKNNGWLIVEHSAKTDLSSCIGFFDKRVYGKVNFSFIKYSE